MHKQFLLSCKKAKITTERDIRQLQDKVRDHTTQYKRIKETNRRTGCSREEWEFFDEIDEILGGRENINPSDTLDAYEDTPVGIQNQLNEIDTDPETENLEDQPVEKRPKRATKTSVMSDAVNAMKESVGEQNRLLAEQITSYNEQRHEDNEFMHQFFAANERSERTQDIFTAIMQLVRK